MRERGRSEERKEKDNEKKIFKKYDNLSVGEKDKQDIKKRYE